MAKSSASGAMVAGDTLSVITTRRVAIYLTSKERATVVKWFDNGLGGLSTMPAANWLDLEGEARLALPDGAVPGYYPCPATLRGKAQWPTE